MLNYLDPSEGAPFIVSRETAERATTLLFAAQHCPVMGGRSQDGHRWPAPRCHRADELQDRRRPVISHRRDVSPPDSDPHDTQAQAAEPETFFDPWAELAPPGFATDALPPVLRAFSEDRARIIGADPCAIAWAAIRAASAALDGSIRLR